jgi:hypothetical protein
MLEPVVVWKVELRRGRDPVDVEGTLTLTDDALVFEDLDGDTTSIDFSEIDRARRQRMSPILLVRHRDTSLGETAFYFAQPPPLGPPDPNTGYLSTKGTVLKPTIQAWVDEVRAKVIAARDGAPG